MTDILEQLSDAKGALRSFATLKGAFSAAEAAVQAIEAARAEIAALREARDALATPQGDIPDDAYNVPTGTPEQLAMDYAALGLPATPQDDAERDWQAWDAELATPDGQAKLARLATSAATVRLTRAQMRVLEHVRAPRGLVSATGQCPRQHPEDTVYVIFTTEWLSNKVNRKHYVVCDEPVTEWAGEPANVFGEYTAEEAAAQVERLNRWALEAAVTDLAAEVRQLRAEMPQA